MIGSLYKQKEGGDVNLASPFFVKNRNDSAWAVVFAAKSMRKWKKIKAESLQEMR